MEAVNSHFERVKPLFDEVPGIVNPTVQSDSIEGSPIAELIDEKHCVREVVFLAETVQKRSRQIGSMASEQLNVENQLCVEVDCSIQPRPLAVDLDSDLVNGDPLRLRLRRVANAIRYAMYPLEDRWMRAFYAE
jgi:hypothetical protein